MPPGAGNRATDRPADPRRGGGADAWPRRRKRPPDLAFNDDNGARKTLADWRGKTVLFNLWATWCVPCRKEMPALDALQAKLGGPDFAVVAVNIDTRDLQKPKAWLKEVGIARLGYFADPSAKVFQDLKEAGKAFGMPTTLLIDGNGCEIATLAGPAEWASEDALKLDLRGARRLKNLNRDIEIAADARRDVGEAVHVLLRRFEQLDGVVRGVRIHAQHLRRHGGLHLAICAAMKAEAIEATSIRDTRYKRGG